MEWVNWEVAIFIVLLVIAYSLWKIVDQLGSMHSKLRTIDLVLEEISMTRFAELKDEIKEFKEEYFRVKFAEDRKKREV